MLLEGLQPMPEQQLLKPSEWSYCDYFWADKKDPQGNSMVSGFEILLQKQLKGKQMQKEMAEFIRERPIASAPVDLLRGGGVTTVIPGGTASSIHAPVIIFGRTGVAHISLVTSE
ncbi:UNVERIFIED_CONTAM: hypothetical protein K2H54_009839 [Gekko kuhli]